MRTLSDKEEDERKGLIRRFFLAAYLLSEASASCFLSERDGDLITQRNGLEVLSRQCFEQIAIVERDGDHATLRDGDIVTLRGT